MTIDIEHVRDAAMGWDISVLVSGGGNEKIAAVRIDVNGFPQVKESFSSPIGVYKKQLNQQGTYPGDNKVLVRATDEKGNETDGIDSWS